MKLSDFILDDGKKASLPRLAYLYSEADRVSYSEQCHISLLFMIRQIAQLAKDSGIDDVELYLVDQYYEKHSDEISNHEGAHSWIQIMVSTMIDQYMGKRLTSDRIIRMLAHVRHRMSQTYIEWRYFEDYALKEEQ